MIHSHNNLKKFITTKVKFNYLVLNGNISMHNLQHNTLFKKSVVEFLNKTNNKTQLINRIQTTASISDI
jgi:hypothetical protein